jgi:Xaa-Pro dipeptidase
MNDLDVLADLYRDHVARLSSGYAAALHESEWDAVVIHSGSAHKRSQFDDQYWPLRPVPHFQHWLPLAEADCALLIVPGQRPTLYRLEVHSFWEAPPPFDAPHVWPNFMVQGLKTAAELGDLLDAGRIAFIGEDRARAASWGLPKTAVNPTELLQQLDALRVQKSPYEIACLAEANKRAAPGHLALEHAFVMGDASELELHLAYLRATQQDDPETPYKNIVALGQNAATLHHIAYGRAVTGAGSLLVDAGATYMGYASDITRTYVRGHGEAADRFGRLVAGVTDLQQRLCADVRIHMPYEDLHERAHQLITALLCDLRLFTCSEAEAAAHKLSRTFLPHGLGHSLGLQCHDVGCALVPPKADNPWLRNTSVIAAQQVFTIEPGVYFIPALLQPLREGALAALVDWRAVDALLPFGGVRIEDDLEVQAVGVRNLTREVLVR